jgi:hypothetical protein
MKNKFKNYLKLGILLFGISLTLVNCQKDDELEKVQLVQKSNFSITKISKTKVQENRTVFSKLTNLKEKLEVKNTNTQNKEIASSEHGFTIDTDYATYIESTDGLYH